MTELEVDVLIVGARVGGALLATRLGVLGWNVLVVDRSSFPSPTLSTHFFRRSGCAGALRDVGVLDDVLASGSPRLVTEYNADALDGTSSQDEPQDPGGLGFNLSVRRTTLDATLVERARREAAVAVREETSLRDLRRDAERAFPERVLAHPFLAPRVTDVAWEGRLMGCGPRDAVIRVPAGPGWALVGDASMHQDPWTGVGMDNAAVHAGLLGEALDDILSGRASEASALARYHGSRDEHALGSFHEMAEIGRDLNVFRQT